MISVGCLLIWMAISLSRKRAVRIRIQDQRWKDIKELEEDYDVYVSDEYAYHIADAKLQLQHMQEFGMSSSNNQNNFNNHSSKSFNQKENRPHNRETGSFSQ